MARKPSSSHRGSRTAGISQGGRTGRTSAVRRANDTDRGGAGRKRTGPREKSSGTKRASTTGRSSRAQRSDEQAWMPDQQAATRGGSDRSAGQRGRPGNRLSEQPDRDTDLENLRRGRDDDAADGGTTETGAERQGMGRGHRRNFAQSDDDAITRGQSRADPTSTTRDSSVNRRSRPMDDSMPQHRPSARGGRPGHRSDW